MTVSNQTSKNVFVGDGATLVFAYTFRIFADADLEVTIQDTSVTPQTEITLVLNTDYTVSGADNPSGGNVTLLLTGQLSSAPIVTDNITIRRNLPFTQPTDYVENDPFPADSHEDALDRGTMIDQQIQEEVDRSLKLSANITGIDVSLPTPLADAPIGWNSDATGLTNNPANTNLSQIDSAASPDFIGAGSGDGVLRVGGNLSYADGGDFVTIDLASSPSITSITLSASLILNGFTVTDILDDDAQAADSATALVTQQSIKAYVDAQIVSQNEFTELTDTPANFSGASLQFTRVNVGETALEFVTITENATHTGDVTGATALTLESVAITGQGAATVASGDLVLIADVDDSNNLKKVTAQSIADLGAGGGDIEVFDEGGSLSTAISSIDFVGAGVEATNVGSAITVTIAGGGGGATLDEDINQTTHGFSVGEWLYHNGTDYALADASAENTAESIGVVSAVAGANDFTIQFGGKITGLSGLTVGEAHFLSETPGAITATAPSTPTAVVKPVLIADSATTGFIFNMRGNTVTDSTSFTDSFTDASLISGDLFINHNLGRQYVQVQIFDDNDQLVQPDNITLANANNVVIDLTSFGTISGTWHFVIMDSGATGNQIASDLVLSGQTIGDLIYFDGTNWVRFAPGASGDVVTSTGAASLPTYQTPSSISADATIKAWILFDGTGAISIRDSFNVSGIVDNAIGKYRVDWDTDFANNNYASVSFGFDSVSSRFMQRTSQGVGFVELESRIIGTEANSDEDGIAVIAIGDQ